MSDQQNHICCNGNCDQCRTCPSRSHGMAPPVDDSEAGKGVVATPTSRARICPPEFRSPTAAFLTGLVAGMALSSAILLVGVTL
ncbi:MAG: hypothetical protein EBR82_09785 [Caulobacteraceae bacterium]|nr:hypothetical protein [Caulobacteraceae bacterium]